MNADYRKGAKHTNRLPEPLPNGGIGDLHEGTASPVPGGVAETGAAPPSQPPNGANGSDSADAGSLGDGDPSPPSNGANGRDEHGRFAKGNPGGPGNPFARRAAQLRRVLSRAVTDARQFQAPREETMRAAQ